MQLLTFGFAHSGRQIHIRENNSGVDDSKLGPFNRAQDTHQRELLLLKENELDCATTQPATPMAINNQLMETLNSRLTHTAAWQAHLTSATWSFASVAAAEHYVEKRPFTIQYIKSIRVVTGEKQVEHLVRVLAEAGCKLHSTELLDCMPYYFGVARLTEAVMEASMMRDEAGIIQHCVDWSCASNIVPPTKDFSDCPLVCTLAGFPTLDDVVVSTSCGMCESTRSECDWDLLLREAELYILQIVAKDGVASPARSRNIANLQATITTIKKKIMA